MHTINEIEKYIDILNRKIAIREAQIAKINSQILDSQQEIEDQNRLKERYECLKKLVLKMIMVDDDVVTQIMEVFNEFKGDEEVSCITQEELKRLKMYANTNYYARITGRTSPYSSKSKKAEELKNFNRVDTYNTLILKQDTIMSNTRTKINGLTEQKTLFSLLKEKDAYLCELLTNAIYADEELIGNIMDLYDSIQDDVYDKDVLEAKLELLKKEIYMLNLPSFKKKELVSANQVPQLVKSNLQN